MKTAVFVLVFVLASPAFAQLWREPLFRKPEPAAPEVLPTPRAKQAPKNPTSLGNLPFEYRQVFRGNPENPVILPSKPPTESLDGISPGDLISADIVGGVIAFPEVEVPILAKVVQGPLQGGLFLGEAKMEQNANRIMIRFVRFRPRGSKTNYPVLAVGRSQDGTLGLAGRHVTGEAKYFSAELLAGFASAYADSLVERSVTPFGQRVEDSSIANAGRKALGSSFARTAEHFGEKLKRNPEYVILEGGATAQILILPPDASGLTSGR